VAEQSARLDAALKQLDAHARELKRSNDELELFAYIASHDLQEPLRMVASYTQLLAARYADRLDADGLEFIGYAVDGARRMQALIEALLQYSRIGSRGLQLGEVDLNETAATVQRNLKLAIEEAGARVEVSSLPTVHADANQMVQLLQNLVANALKFRAAEAPVVEVYAGRAGKHALVTVRDNGIGLDPRFAERIFLLFQRLHSQAEYAGVGIGLTICKKIVERHGGQIWVESEPGRGASFHFTLPLSPRAEL
jgi:light-regulated signal transduction histidine kinase (bacteriophytochrome)